MRPICLYIILTLSLLVFSCNSGTDKSGSTHEEKIRKQISAVAEKYIMGQVSEQEKIVTENGMIIFGGDQKRYLLDPAKIYTGLINDDNRIDAIVSLSVFQGNYQTVSEQLIILRQGNDYILALAVESDMIIISLEDKIITADVPEHSRDNPLFSCPTCREVMKFRFEAGELIRVE